MNDGYDSLLNLLPKLENETILKHMDDKNNFYFFESENKPLFYFDFINKNVSFLALDFNKYLEKKWAKVNKLPYQELTFQELKNKILPRQIFKIKENNNFYKVIFTFIDDSPSIYFINIVDGENNFPFTKIYSPSKFVLNSKWVIIG